MYKTFYIANCHLSFQNFQNTNDSSLKNMSRKEYKTFQSTKQSYIYKFNNDSFK